MGIETTGAGAGAPLGADRTGSEGAVLDGDEEVGGEGSEQQSAPQSTNGV